MSDWMKTLNKGPRQSSPRIVVYGTHGIGKSTLAAQFPAPIFISTEDGLDSLDVVSFPKATSMRDVQQSIGTLIKENHEFKTVVIDSVDWLCDLIVEHVEATHDAKDLAYGKGQMITGDEFRKILQGLDMLRKDKGMNVVLIAHADVVRIENPITEPYSSYQPKLPKRCNALLMEWADVMAFAAFKVIIKKTDAGFNKEVTRGVSTGERLLHLVETAGYAAKNRYGAPNTIEMSFQELVKHVPVKQ